jgi:trehalose 6-phosphate phosphatase
MEPRLASFVAARVPPVPPPGRLALLLDLDGTLLDIAPSPTEVRVPPTLPDVLRRLRARLGGALAVVSGRTIESVAALLPGLGLAIAGEHGGAIRLADGLPIERGMLPEVPPDWREAAHGLAASFPGVLFEPKPHGFVLHFRQAPGAGPALAAALADLLAGSPERFVLLPAAMAWEVRPRGVNKGRAVRELLRRPPFAGRSPVFVGDDTTDEDGIRAAREAGGLGFMVDQTFGDAAGVRAWLASLAGACEDAEGAA